MRVFPHKLAFIAIFAALSLPIAAQTKGKTNKRPVAKPTPATATAKPQPTPEVEPETPATKRNDRPDASATKTSSIKAPVLVPVYSYVFTRPGFTYSRIAIEHDEAGKGQISFQRSEFDEAFVDPIDLSAVTMANLREAFDALNFLSSTDEYQIAGRDYSHMGNVEIKVKKAGRERAVKYNWTENKSAKLLMDEYRRITNEYTWRFEIITARQNQPLLTPGLMDLIDSYLKRAEITDPPHLVPFLTELSTDERLPLMARNRALKLIKDIEKGKKS